MHSGEGDVTCLHFPGTIPIGDESSAAMMTSVLVDPPKCPTLDDQLWGVGITVAPKPRIYF